MKNRYILIHKLYKLYHRHTIRSEGWYLYKLSSDRRISDNIPQSIINSYLLHSQFSMLRMFVQHNRERKSYK